MIEANLKNELESRSELGTENEAEIIQNIIDNWKKELPEEISDWFASEVGEITLREDVFKDFDANTKRMKGNNFEKEHWEKSVAENDDTNNFHLMFIKWMQEQVLSGKIGDALAGLKPFYINSRYSNAWSRMCEIMPEEIKTAVNFQLRRDKGSVNMTKQEKEAFKKLAIYLNKNEGVVMTLLCQ